MWKQININRQNIKTECEKAVLIQMPHNSDYDGYCFWHPSKLVRDGRNKNAISIGYTEEFEFKLIKYGKGKYNQKTILDEKKIDVEEFEASFGTMNDNIVVPKKDAESYLKVEEPKKLERKINVVEELMNIKVGEKIEIIYMDDPYVSKLYAGRIGIVENIDAIGQLHGTWGSCALIPGVDKFKLIHD